MPFLLDDDLESWTVVHLSIHYIYCQLQTYIDGLHFTLHPASLSILEHQSSLLDVSEIRPTVRHDRTIGLLTATSAVTRLTSTVSTLSWIGTPRSRSSFKLSTWKQSLVASLCTMANNGTPNWRCRECLSGGTSQDMLDPRRTTASSASLLHVYINGPMVIHISFNLQEPFDFALDHHDQQGPRLNLDR